MMGVRTWLAHTALTSAIPGHYVSSTQQTPSKCNCLWHRHVSEYVCEHYPVSQLVTSSSSRAVLCCRRMEPGSWAVARVWNSSQGKSASTQPSPGFRFHDALSADHGLEAWRRRDENIRKAGWTAEPGAGRTSSYHLMLWLFSWQHCQHPGCKYDQPLHTLMF